MKLTLHKKRSLVVQTRVPVLRTSLIFKTLHPQSFSNNTIEKDDVLIVDLISEDPAEWVINYLTIDRLLLKEIKQNIVYKIKVWK